MSGFERARFSPPGGLAPLAAAPATASRGPQWLVGRQAVNVTAIVDALGYPAAGLGILIESAGVPFPGEALLLAAAAWAAARNHSIVLVILFGFLGSVVGADLGYFLGHRGGRPFVERFGHLFRIRPEHIARSELFFARHGDRAILLGRFQLFSALGGLLWATVIGAAGYFLGSNLNLIEAVIRAIGIGGLAIIAVV